MFSQTQEEINYISAIYKLTENLGISSSFMEKAENIRDELIYHPDSLFDKAR